MSISKLPSMEHTFTVSISGQRTKRMYDGTFTFKIPSLAKKSEISKTYARLNGGLELPEKVEQLHYCVAFLNQTLTEAPEWWDKNFANLDNLDYNVYTEVFNECIKFEEDWDQKVLGEDEEKTDA